MDDRKLRAALGLNRLTSFAVKIGDHRYWLHRRFPDGEGVTVFGMLNPSRADGERNDPTTRRCMDFARMWDTRYCILVNLYSYSSHEPDELYEVDKPIGPLNEMCIAFACELVKERGGKFVIAWGSHPLARLQAPNFLATLKKNGIRPYHLGLTKERMPRHPLYAPSNSELQEWRVNA